MRKIAATYLFPIHKKPIKNGILICSDEGKILDIVDNKGFLKEESGIEYYSGILVPGFVNTHCHLELSHLKGKIEEKTGIGGFIGKINQLRNEQQKLVEKAIQINDRMLWANGTAAVGDISNSAFTIQTKLKSKIQYHTFIESFGFHPKRATRAFELAKSVQNEFQKNKLSQSIVPHSPYSVSDLLFEKISENARAENSILSIHNQESKGESEFFETGSGPIANHLKNNLRLDISHWKPSGKSSLQTVLQYIPAKNQLILVHNTTTKEDDIHFLKKNRNSKNTFFALCPNSNLYIENQLPPLHLFLKEDIKICLGTDSLASNHTLSVLEEMKTLQFHFPEILLGDLLKWATLNGAEALKMDAILGTFEVGKTPGINLISGIDFKTQKLTPKSKIKRLL